jgi:DNA-binding FrmR family transcriptional regulator
MKIPLGGIVNAATKKKLLARLKRAEGQIAALRRMIEEDHYCVDVLLQISAAQGALGKAGELLLGSHVRTCVRDAFEKGDDDDRETKIEELMEVFARYGRIGGS